MAPSSHCGQDSRQLGAHCLAGLHALDGGAALRRSAGLWRGRAPVAEGAEAGNLERRLRANPEDLAVCGRLVTYYYWIAAREPRLKHIFWLIEHHPESEIIGFSSAQISPGGGTLNDDADYPRARDIWLRQVRRKASDPLALGNAVKFFWQPGGDLGTAADLLKRLRQLEASVFPLDTNH